MLIALSSTKPSVESNPYNSAYQELQAQAIASWCRIFDHILLVNQDHAQPYRDSKIFVVKGDDCPRIKDLARAASTLSELPGYICIMNADIVVNEELKLVQSLMDKSGCRAATSRRWNFNNSIQDAKLMPGDNGLDIFMATPEAWEYVASVIPDGLRIGIPGWDNWLIQCFYKRYGHSFRNFTKWKCVFHAHHPVSERQFSHDVKIEDFTPHIKEL